MRRVAKKKITPDLKYFVRFAKKIFVKNICLKRCVSFSKILMYARTDKTESVLMDGIANNRYVK